MSEIKVERICPADSTTKYFKAKEVHGKIYAANVLKNREEERLINWPSFGSVTPTEARAFAQAIIAVADAVEREGKG